MIGPGSDKKKQTMLVFASIGDICILPRMACVLLGLLDDQTTLMGTIYSGLQLNTHTVT